MIVIVVLMCLKAQCLEGTIPFRGTMWECTIEFRGPVAGYMEGYPGFTLRHAYCTYQVHDL